MADTTLAEANLGATPKTPLSPVQGHRTILALDLGTTTGWAIRGFDGLITSGTVSFKPGRYDGGGMRYLRFTNWLSEINRLSGPIGASISKKSAGMQALTRPMSTAACWLF